MLSSVKDDNFCFPIPEDLETDKLKLVPFISSLHAEALINPNDIGIWQYMPLGPFSSAQEFVEKFYEEYIRRNRGDTMFVGLDKTRLNANGDPTLAGMAGYVFTNPEDLWTEIFIVVLPQFHRTHVASHMAGLLMRYALNLPSEGGLGLRRVQWLASVQNTGSIGLAKKLGMKMEGIKRWARVLEPSKAAVGNNGGATRKGDPREDCPGRDTAFLALCWDEWEDGEKERVESILKT